MREITDQDYPSLAKPGDDMALNPPQPADPEHWVQVSMDQNLSLLSSRLAADVARDAVEVSRAGHFPTVGITASRGAQNLDTNETSAFGGPPASVRYPGSQNSNEVQLQVTVPIFSGGATQSQVRQAQYNWIAAKDHVQVISRQTEHLARDSYNGLVSKIAQVNALRQGLESAQVALQATQAGYDVGTRTAVEVLQGRQSLVQAQTSYAQSRYDYLLDIINLRLAAGTLNRGHPGRNQQIPDRAADRPHYAASASGPAVGSRRGFAGGVAASSGASNSIARAQAPRLAATTCSALAPRTLARAGIVPAALPRYAPVARHR